MSFQSDMEIELNYAQSKFAGYHSYHEAYAVILEELDEFWEIVRQQDNDRDPIAARKELLQIAVTAWRAAIDLELE